MAKKSIDEERLNREALKLAKRRGLPTQRVRSVLHEIEPYSNNDLGISPLHIALEYADPLKALEAFEKENYRDLLWYTHLLSIILSSGTPPYTIDELADVTKKYITHLERNKRHLLQTGYPETSFARSPWLDLYLSRLYFTKVQFFNPLWGAGYFNWLKSKGEEPPNSMNVGIDNDGNILHKYYWMEEPAEFIESVDPITKESTYQYKSLLTHEPPKRATLCRYEDAALIKGLSEEDDKQLERLREKVFKIKIQILERLLQALDEERVNSLWQDCFKIISDELLAKDLDYLLSKDKRYAHIEIDFSEYTSSHIVHNGTLSDLLEIIGYYEKELTFRAMHMIREKVLDLPVQPLLSYYQSLGQPWRRHLDNILVEFEKLETEEKDFWEEYREKVNDALENEFYEEPVPGMKVKRKLFNRFEPHITFISDIIKAHEGAIKAFPQFSISILPECKPFKKQHVIATSEYTRSLNCDSVKVKSKPYTFAPVQAAALRVLFDCYEAGVPDVSQHYILEAVGSKAKQLRDILSDSPAWRKWIVPGDKKGTFRLKF